MDAITPNTPKVETRLLPALAAAIAEWFPMLNGRAMAVSEAAVTKENIPTLPLVAVALQKTVSDQSLVSRQSQYELQDHFIVDFWLVPERYQRANGTEAPFWSYYNYEAIRDKLLTHLASWQAPRNAKIAFRDMDIDADPLFVTLTFRFVASINWKACVTAPPDQIIDGIGFNLLTAAFDCCAPECVEPDPCDPSTEESSNGDDLRANERRTKSLFPRASNP